MSFGILIADREGHICHQIGARLSKKFWIWTFTEGKKGLEKLRKSQADILISGLRLKDMRGLDFINQAKEIHPQIYVIIAGSAPAISKKMMQLKDAASDFIIKPINEEQLNLVLKRAVDRQQLLKKEEFYRELSILDHLTLVYNRRYLDLELGREIERSKRFTHSFSLLILDIDNFKVFNDKNGHLAGDSLLQRFAKILMKTSRIMDLVFRLGGDEFLILSPETSKKDAISFAQRIEATVREEKFEGINVLPASRLSSSIGIASFPDDGHSAEALISMADRMMYKAKKKRNHKVCFAGQP